MVVNRMAAAGRTPRPQCMALAAASAAAADNATHIDHCAWAAAAAAAAAAEAPALRAPVHACLSTHFIS